MLILLSTLIRLYIFTPGRRVYALRQVLERARARALHDIVHIVNMALMHEETSAELESAWGAAQASREQKPRDIDLTIDRFLLMIESILDHHAGDPDRDIATHAAGLSSALFPQGASYHIRLPYVDQLIANERVLAVLSAPEHQAWIDRLGLRILATRLAELNTEFRAALLSRDSDPGVSFEAVRASRERGQELLLQVVARILGRFAGDEDAQVRTELLQPILDQNEAIRTYRRRRRKVADVDADTGEPIEDELDQDTAPTAQSPRSPRRISG